ncbi:hypothetical protein LCGC14_2843360, partial [marine sediment metagenome]
DLRDKGRSPDTELVLQALFQASEQEIAAFFQPAPEDVAGLVEAVFPGSTPEEVGELVQADFDGFIDAMRQDGSTEAKRDLLRAMGFTQAEIAQVFRIQHLNIPVDGSLKRVTIDTATFKAFDEEGRWVGSYHPVTKEYSSLPEEGRIKDTVDAFRFAAAGAWERTEGFFLSTVPNLVFQEIDASKLDEKQLQLYGQTIEQHNKRNQELRNEFRSVYGENKRDFDQWLTKRPEIQPNRPKYEQGAFQHPELLKDFWYFAYEVASIAPYLLASAAAAGAATLATGNPLAGIAAGGAVFIPSETEAVRQELLANGMPEEQADQVALAAGTLIGALEGIGHIPLFKALSPQLMRLFRKEAGKEVARLTMAELNKSVSQLYED